MKMYSLWKMGFFSIAMLAYQGVSKYVLGWEVPVGFFDFQVCVSYVSVDP